MQNLKNTSKNCPNCGKNLKLSDDDFFYGSPIRQCPHCKQSYADYCYHEIALEGVRERDVRLQTTEEYKKSIKRGFIWLGVGLAAIALYAVTGLEIGFFLLIGLCCIIVFFASFKKDSEKKLSVRVKAIEEEKQRSLRRMEDPDYVDKLIKAGFTIPEDFNAAANAVTATDGAYADVKSATELIPDRNETKPESKQGFNQFAGLGGAAVLTGIIGAFFLAIPFGILGLKRSKHFDGEGKTSSIIGIVLGCVWIVVFVTCFLPMIIK